MSSATVKIKGSSLTVYSTDNGFKAKSDNGTLLFQANVVEMNKVASSVAPILTPLEGCIEYLKSVFKDLEVVDIVDPQPLGQVF